MNWVQLCSSLNILWHCSSLGLEWNDLFQACGHCWVFQIWGHIECSTFTASSFRNWNSSTGIPSPPLALFIVMLPKAHLSSHSRMSGSRWVITPSLLSGLLRSFFYSSCVYFCHLFLISSASVRSIPFLSFIEPIFAWNVPLISLIFLKRSLVFPILLFSSISLHWSWRKAFLSLLAILWKSAFKWVYLSFPPLLFTFFFSQLFVRPLQTAILLFCIYFFVPWLDLGFCEPVPLDCEPYQCFTGFSILCTLGMTGWVEWARVGYFFSPK